MLVFDIETGPADDETLAEQFTLKTKEEFVGDRNWKAETIDAKYEEYRLSAFENLKRKAALDATTGHVLAIGLKDVEGTRILDSINEEKLLLDFWKIAELQEWRGGMMVGHNCLGFDLPFLMRRSWMLGIEFPRLTVIKDTMKVWGCGVYGETISLDRLSKALGVGGKSAGITGADFAWLWNGDEEDHNRARQYLTQDLELIWKCAVRLKVSLNVSERVS